MNFKTLLLMLFTVGISSACSENSVMNEAPIEVTNANTDINASDNTNDSTKTVSNPNLLFEDNFDTNGTPDKTKWTLCPKMAGDSWGNYFSNSYDQAYVSNGNLVLKAEKVNGVYKTGGVWSKGLFDFTYGKVEVRARLKTVQGGIPSIWLLDSSGIPSEGEIDIVEQFNNDNFVYHTVWNNYIIKYNKLDPIRSSTSKYNVGEYNTYTLNWTPEKLEYSVNGKIALTYPNLHLTNEATLQQWPFKKSSFIILNFTLSMGTTITDADLPGYMEVDWVRVTRTR